MPTSPDLSELRQSMDFSNQENQEAFGPVEVIPDPVTGEQVPKYTPEQEKIILKAKAMARDQKDTDETDVRGYIAELRQEAHARETRGPGGSPRKKMMEAVEKLEKNANYDEKRRGEQWEQENNP